MLQVSDDSGLLALVVPADYESFVSKKWKLEQLLSHFKSQMARRTLLVWGTGLEGFWNVKLMRTKSKAKGFREVVGPIRVTGGALLLTNYESLTMAAQFNDVKLPEKHQEDLLVPLADGEYQCRIIQMFDPDQEESAGDDKPDFVVEVLKTDHEIAAWENVPWFEIDA